MAVLPICFCKSSIVLSGTDCKPAEARSAALGRKDAARAAPFRSDESESMEEVNSGGWSEDFHGCGEAHPWLAIANYILSLPLLTGIVKWYAENFLYKRLRGGEPSHAKIRRRGTVGQERLPSRAAGNAGRDTAPNRRKHEAGHAPNRQKQKRETATVSLFVYAFDRKVSGGSPQMTS